MGLIQGFLYRILAHPILHPAVSADTVYSKRQGHRTLVSRPIKLNSPFNDEAAGEGTDLDVPF
jgi:hypothetical protein